MKNKILKLFLIICLTLCVVGCDSGVKAEKTDDIKFEIHFIDVGQGDAALVRCESHYMLIDCGTSREKVGLQNLKDALSEVNKLDYIVLSHLHEDHAGNLKDVIKQVTDVGRVLSNSESPEYEERAFWSDIEKELINRDLEITVPKIGDKFQLGSAEIEIIDNRAEDHNDSLVLLITYGEKNKKCKVLFTGDMTSNAERYLCEKYGSNWKVDILKVAHHGSSYSTTIRFIDMLQPDYAVISVGKKNIHGHPSEQTLSRLKQAGIQTYRTDLLGTISFEYDGEKIMLQQ